MHCIPCTTLLTAAFIACGGLEFRFIPSNQQNTSSSRTFEVASVRPSGSKLPVVGGTPIYDVRYLPGGRFEAEHISLRRLALIAYKLTDAELEGGPSWINSDLFDITATTEAQPDPGIDPAEFQRLLLRGLLTARFHLVVHTETRDLPVQTLGNDGSNIAKASGLRQSTLGCSGNEPTPALLPNTWPDKCGILLRPGYLIGGGLKIDRIVEALSAMLKTTVVDKTGLSGAFDVNLHWTPDFYKEIVARIGKPGPIPSSGTFSLDPDGPSLPDAVREQLGLTLKQTKAPSTTLLDPQNRSMNRE